MHTNTCLINLLSRSPSHRRKIISANIISNLITRIYALHDHVFFRGRAFALINVTFSVIFGRSQSLSRVTSRRVGSLIISHAQRVPFFSLGQVTFRMSMFRKLQPQPTCPTCCLAGGRGMRKGRRQRRRLQKSSESCGEGNAEGNHVTFGRSMYRKLQPRPVVAG